MSLSDLGSGTDRRHAGLGTRRLWSGLVVLTALQLALNLGTTLLSWGVYERPHVVITAWVVLLVAAAAVTVVTYSLGEHLPSWLFALFVVAIGVAIALDAAALWHLEGDLSPHLTVAIAARGGLLLAVATRRARDVIIALVAITLETVALVVAHGGIAAEDLHNVVYMAIRGTLLVLVAVMLMATFRRFVKTEVARSLSHAAIASPRLALSLQDSEALARLDLAAESLLSAVAEGRVQLPLTPEVAKRAGALAGDLRVHLLARRSKTWLGIAIGEAEVLQVSIAIVDPDAAAGLLNTRQRLALLSAIWLLHDQLERRRGRGELSATTIEFGSAYPAEVSEVLSVVPIRLSAPWAARSTVEPGIWDYLAQVGPYRESAEDGLTIDIRCLVADPSRTP